MSMREWTRQIRPNSPNRLGQRKAHRQRGGLGRPRGGQRIHRGGEPAQIRLTHAPRDGVPHVPMGIDHPRHQKTAGQVDPLGPFGIQVLAHIGDTPARDQHVCRTGIAAVHRQHGRAGQKHGGLRVGEGGQGIGGGTCGEKGAAGQHVISFCGNHRVASVSTS